MKWLKFSENSVDQGMYQYISTAHLLLMVKYLAKSHHFARQFNSNALQRNVLWKAGFRGPVRPNLLKQETQSLACALRILFRLYDDETRRDEWSDVTDKLTELGREALEYYVTLETESHRDAWSPLMLLFLSRVTQLSDDKVMIDLDCHETSSLITQSYFFLFSSLKPTLVAGTSSSVSLFHSSWNQSFGHYCEKYSSESVKYLKFLHHEYALSYYPLLFCV